MKMGKISKKQIAAIHVLKAKLKLSDENYRAILSGYGVESSKDLNEKDAKDLIKRLNAVANKDNREFRYIPDRATPRQIRKIKALWQNYSRAKTEESLNKFVKRTTGIDRLEWLRVDDATKVILGIQKLKIEN